MNNMGQGAPGGGGVHQAPSLPSQSPHSQVQTHQQQQQQNLMPQASPHGNTMMTVPSPAPSAGSTNQGPPVGTPQGAGGVHAPSLPSQSPHSQHNMTSPHPQPSPHQTSPHPMTISPAAHSPYASGGPPQGGGVHGPPSLPSQSPHNMPQPQPSPQPSQTQQQQQQVSNPVPSGRQAVQVNELNSREAKKWCQITLLSIFSLGYLASLSRD